MPDIAHERFETAVRTYVEALLTVRAEAEHSKARIDAAQKALSGERPTSIGPPRGRRWDAAQVNRPVIILSVSIWEAYVEDITRAVHRGRTAANLTTCTQQEVDNLVESLSTPNSTKCVHRWIKAGMDIEASWPLVSGGLTGTFPETMLTLDAWMHVRHQFAHSLSVTADSPSAQASSAAAEWATMDPRVTGNGNSRTNAWNDLVRDEVGRLLPNTAKVTAALGGGRQRSVHLHQAQESINFFRLLAIAVRDAANRSI